MTIPFIDRIAQLKQLEDDLNTFSQTIEEFHEMLSEEQVGNPVWLVEIEDMARRVHMEIHELFGPLEEQKETKA